MSAKKYLVLPVTGFTTAIQAKLKNYGQTPNYLFIEDTVATVRHITRLDNSADYVILKVSQGTTAAEIRDLIPGFNQGNDPYNRLYNDNVAFQTFLTENFVNVQP